MPGSADIFINNASPTSFLKLRSGRVILKKTGGKSHALANLASDRNNEDTIPTFPFLKLPAELRVRIYRYLLHANGNSIYIDRNYEKMTYQVTATGVHPALLSVNRQTYLEASRVFYSENCFNFLGIHGFLRSISEIKPFLEDRSEGSRRLIKQIKFGSFLVDFWQSTFVPTHFAYLDRGFEKICGYLNQCLQLKHVELCIFVLFPQQIGLGMPYKADLAKLDQQNWIQQLVPLVKNLDSIKITRKGDYDDDLTSAAQTYLESKMHKVDEIVRQSQIVQDLADASAASEK